MTVIEKYDGLSDRKILIIEDSIQCSEYKISIETKNHIPPVIPGNTSMINKITINKKYCWNDLNTLNILIGGSSVFCIPFSVLTTLCKHEISDEHKTLYLSGDIFFKFNKEFHSFTLWRHEMRVSIKSKINMSVTLTASLYNNISYSFCNSIKQHFQITRFYIDTKFDDTDNIMNDVYYPSFYEGMYLITDQKISNISLSFYDETQNYIFAEYTDKYIDECEIFNNTHGHNIVMDNLSNKHNISVHVLHNIKNFMKKKYVYLIFHDDKNNLNKISPKNGIKVVLNKKCTGRIIYIFNNVFTYEYGMGGYLYT